jgi:5-methylcytosine-specific restriction protein A
LAIDPSYSGKGMQSYSQQDKDIFFEFYQDKDTLRRIATSIFNVLSNNSAAEKLYKILDEDDEAIGAKEGKVLYVLHKVRERDRRIVSRKKKEATRKFNKLACEVCGFDFYALYGELGEGFIECHHVSPLAEYRADQETRLEDLALVCSNCHRMLHKKINYLTPERLKSLIKHSNEERNWT